MSDDYKSGIGGPEALLGAALALAPAALVWAARPWYSPVKKRRYTRIVRGRSGKNPQIKARKLIVMAKPEAPKGTA